ncbi:chemotaxis protein CheA [Pseudoroseomonas rhizosphaerae]|uniref:Chemotaxis protein CheA n=1 Tax=Teichococcus rhizosphaerae TaxID=1335062 RepID=A0A2C6Z442_9PROT|nr:chemotaxis protein CheW [Pseudoroseomonas rhizosphaerae]PHK93291.1 chemotaxis protein CheA [Pseudoroseomonas rhizosphaerae]
MSELRDQFLIEARELLEQMAEALPLLRAPRAEPSRLDRLYRAVHTLKGSVGLFPLAPMGLVLHALEDRLDALRAAPAGPEDMAALQDAALRCEAWLEAFASRDALPGDAAAEAAALAARLRAVGQAPRGAVPAPPAAGAEAAWPAALAARHAAALEPAWAEGRRVTALRYRPDADCFFLGEDPLALLRRLPGLLALEVAPRAPWPAPARLDPYACNLEIRALAADEPEALRQVFRFVADQCVMAELPPAPPARPAPAPDAAPARPLRVEPARVEALAARLGELAVAGNALAPLAARAAALDPALGRDLAGRQAAIIRLVAELDRMVAGLRRLPLARSFRRLPALARETAARLGKEVSLEMEGEALEADRAIVEGLYEPLLHLVRNALDHGIEPPEARRALGKPAAGRLHLVARRAGERLEIALSDDGAGLDPDRLRAAALARGVADAAALDEAALHALLFAPGFSTATDVSDISGRGVGMDAVRAAIAALGGRVALESRRGEGATVRLSLPQAAALRALLLLRAGGEDLAVPVEAVAETLRLPAARILPLGGAAAFVLRGRTVPLLDLGGLLGLPRAAGRETGEAARVLVTAGARPVGLAVEAFGRRLDAPLRPLEGLMAGMPGLLGTMLDAGGRVRMVLDLPGLTR